MKRFRLEVFYTDKTTEVLYFDSREEAERYVHHDHVSDYSIIDLNNW